MGIAVWRPVQSKPLNEFAVVPETFDESEIGVFANPQSFSRDEMPK